MSTTDPRSAAYGLQSFVRTSIGSDDYRATTQLAPRSSNYRGRDTGEEAPMSQQLTPQDQQDIRDLTDDFFCFQAAARGPESRFAPGDRVTPTFAAEAEIGTVLATAPAHWAIQNCYPGPQSSHAKAKWASGAVEVFWPKLGTAWWPSDSLQKAGA